MKGHITIFLSLTIVLVFSAIGAVTEMARLQAADSHIEGILELGADSVMAEYDKDLLKEFDLFFLDGSYGRGNFSEWNIVDRLETYMTYNIQDGRDLPAVRGTDLWQFRVEETGLEQLVMATDDAGKPFRRQAAACMEAQIGLLLLEELQQYGAMGKEAEDAGNVYEAARESNDSEWEELERELEASEEEWDYQDADNPLKDVEQLKKLSILQLVAENPGDLSTKKTDLASLVSQRECYTGYGKITGEEVEHSTLLFREYLINYMGHVASPADNRHLNYELEYIIAGKDSDIQNLESVVNQLLLIREGMNFAYLMTDQQKQREAYAMAGAVAAGFPPLVAVLQKGLLLAWAWGESIVDVRTLLAGGQIPFWKTKDSWQLALENLATLKADEAQESPGDMGYSSYLRMLLYIGKEEQQGMRALDMIEGRIQMCREQPGFRLDWCVSELEFYTRWDKGTVFFRLPGDRTVQKWSCQKY